MTPPARSPGLFDASPRLPDGFLYRPGFVSGEEERALLDGLAGVELGEVRMHGVVARRRVAQFGWRYTFDSRSLEPGRELPDFLAFLQQRVAAVARVEASELSEVLVTEYTPGATIGWHRDAPPFGIVAGVSLAAPCRLRFRRERDDGWDRTEVRLEPRSLYVLSGFARTEWQHSIPPVEQLRYSITFRTLRRRRATRG